MNTVSQPEPARAVSWRHQVVLRHGVGAFNLDLEFEITNPWTVLFAPSGGGKTTVLRMIAGLERPDAGSVILRVTRPLLEEQEFVLTDTASGAFVPPHKRVVRMVAQRPALFPHKTVLGNVKYGMRESHRDAEERQASLQALDAILSLSRLGHLRHKMPSQLSGGERQRVALARAIAADECNLLLLDEPFSGFDAALREEVIADLKTWTASRRIPVFMVTHDLGEVFTSGAEVLKMHQGKIVARGPASDVLHDERRRLIQTLGAN